MEDGADGMAESHQEIAATGLLQLLGRLASLVHLFLHLMANLSLLHNEDLKVLQFKLPGSIRRRAAVDGRVPPL